MPSMARFTQELHRCDPTRGLDLAGWLCSGFNLVLDGPYAIKWEEAMRAVRILPDGEAALPDAFHSETRKSSFSSPPLLLEWF